MGIFVFPGGGFEDGVDETFKDTALRETQEELGIERKDIKVLGQWILMLHQLEQWLNLLLQE